MTEKPIMMTQARYARHRGKSPQYIGKFAKAGILVMRGRMVDAAASDAVLDDKPDDAPTGQQPTTFAQARLARRQDSSAERPTANGVKQSHRISPLREHARNVVRWKGLWSGRWDSNPTSSLGISPSFDSTELRCLRRRTACYPESRIHGPFRIVQ